MNLSQDLASSPCFYLESFIVSLCLFACARFSCAAMIRIFSLVIYSRSYESRQLEFDKEYWSFSNLCWAKTIKYFITDLRNGTSEMFLMGSLNLPALTSFKSLMIASYY